MKQMKKSYMEPAAEIHCLKSEQMMQAFTQVDNDGEGGEDPVPITPGDPPGGIGAKPNPFGDDSWED